MTTRRWMVVVAVVALGCAATILVKKRRERFVWISRLHTYAYPPISFVDVLTTSGLERERRLLLSTRVIAWHAQMAKKYEHAARYPWLPLEPDPPMPARP
jgi:hypothetical protein